MLALVRSALSSITAVDFFAQKWREPGLRCLLLNDCNPRLQQTTTLIVDLDPKEEDGLWWLARSLPGWHVEPLGESSARLTPPAFEPTGGVK